MIFTLLCASLVINALTSHVFITSCNLDLQVPEVKVEEGTSRTLSHVGVPHHERVLVGGRICCDGVGRINPKSLILEGVMRSRKYSQIITSYLKVLFHP